MPRLRLPPLPPPAEWRTTFPRSGGHPYRFTLDRAAIDTSMASREANRVSLADASLCDKFVRDLGIRENEVIIDAYANVGQLTRSLLTGGRNETTAEDWERVKTEQAIVGPYVGEFKRKTAGEFDYPPWDVTTAPKPYQVTEEQNAAVVQPKLVIASESTFSSVCRGLGVMPTIGEPTAQDPFSEKEEMETKKRQRKHHKERGIYPTLLEKNLLFCSHSVYHWGTIPNILNDPLVIPSLEVYDKTKTGIEATYRPWTAPPPPVTVVVTVPTTPTGDQMISQWISSAIGSDTFGRSWLWKWGRARIAALVHKGLYDRILARPGETIHCKLSIMANALFDIRPLPPYHHVPDVDKHSARTDPVVPPEPKYKSIRSKVKPTRAAPSPTEEITLTRQLDFHTWGGGMLAKERVTENAYLPRPLLLGIELIPRLDTPVKAEQREMWDFVLRKCFVRETNDISAAIPKLAFGADNLIPRIAEGEGSRYAGAPVPPDTTVRDLTIEQWARVVDVFDKWAFKPDNLLVDVPVLEDSREIGISF